MEKNNIVSVWIGKFDNKENFKNYFQEHYDEEGDVFSEFMKDFEIDYIDNQFLEKHHLDNISSFQDLIEPMSYSENFKNKIYSENLNDINTIICAYNYEYLEALENNGSLKFLGVFTYENS